MFELKKNPLIEIINWKEKNKKIKGLTRLNIHSATLHQLILDRRPKSDTIFPFTEGDIGGTVDVDVVATGDPGTHLPLHPPINLHIQQYHPSHQVLVQHITEIGSQGNWISVQKWRPNYDVLVALVGGGQQRR